MLPQKTSPLFNHHPKTLGNSANRNYTVKHRSESTPLKSIPGSILRKVYRKHIWDILFLLIFVLFGYFYILWDSHNCGFYTQNKRGFCVKDTSRQKVPHPKLITWRTCHNQVTRSDVKFNISQHNGLALLWDESIIVGTSTVTSRLYVGQMAGGFSPS